MFRYMALTWNAARLEQWETVEFLSHRLTRLSSQWCNLLAACASSARIHTVDRWRRNVSRTMQG